MAENPPDPAPVSAPWFEPVPAPASAPSRRSRWAKLAAVGVVGILVGGAAGTTSASAASKDRNAARTSLADESNQLMVAQQSLVSLQSQLEQSKASELSAEGRIAGAQSDADARAAAADSAKQSDLDTQKAALDARSGVLDQREAAVTGEERTYAANTLPGDGTYLVGKDVAPGTYTSTGNVSSCYWSRNSSSGDIIDNDIAKGQLVVTVRASDFSVTTAHCNAYHRA